MDEPTPRGGSKLLLHEEPLQVLPGLAIALGLNEAIILQQMHYWLRRSTYARDGHFWIYNTYEDWHAQFPFWAIRTIRRVIRHLEDLGMITSAEYNTSQLDKTKWYTINYNKISELEDSIGKDHAGNIVHSGNRSGQFGQSSGQIGHTESKGVTAIENDFTIVQSENSMWPNWPHGLANLATSFKGQETTRQRSNSREQTTSSLRTANAVPNGEGWTEEGSASGQGEHSHHGPTPLETDDWLCHLLTDYADTLPFDALNDDAWWTDVGNSFPSFERPWVERALSALCVYLRDHPHKRPRTPKGWRTRINYSLNKYYTDIESRRMPHGPTTLR